MFASVAAALLRRAFRLRNHRREVDPAHSPWPERTARRGSWKWCNHRRIRL